MILIQRVRVRWTADARGAPAANARRGLVRAMPLPRALPEGEVVVHDVLADRAAGYEHRDGVRAGDVALTREAGLWLGRDQACIVVDRLPGSAAFPRPSASARLFTLAPGQVGRYRANFRFTGCGCDPSWYYEEWLVHVGHGAVASFGRRTATSTTACTCTGRRQLSNQTTSRTLSSPCRSASSRMPSSTARSAGSRCSASLLDRRSTRHITFPERHSVPSG